MRKLLLLTIALAPLSVLAQSASVASTPGTCSTVTASATLLAANARRIGVIITVPTGVAKRIRYRLTSSATTSSPPLEPGQVLVLGGSYKGAIAVISDDGSTSTTVCASEW